MIVEYFVSRQNCLLATLEYGTFVIAEQMAPRPHEDLEKVANGAIAACQSFWDLQKLGILK